VKKSVEGFSNSYVRSEHGCKQCGGTGTKGRVLIAELIMFDDKCREHIANHDLAALEKHLLNNGWKGMASRARMRIEQGVIDPYEAVKHVTNLFKEESDVKYPDVEFVNNGLELA
jgi:general secretion pathway protein E